MLLIVLLDSGLAGIPGARRLRRADLLQAIERARAELGAAKHSVILPVAMRQEPVDGDAERQTPLSTESEALTPREVEVLELVGRGESNRAIAEALVVSVRTVERHLVNIYAKTGVQGRQQLRAYARGYVARTPI